MSKKEKEYVLAKLTELTLTSQHVNPRSLLDALQADPDCPLTRSSMHKDFAYLMLQLEDEQKITTGPQGYSLTAPAPTPKDTAA